MLVEDWVSTAKSWLLDEMTILNLESKVWLYLEVMFYILKWSWYLRVYLDMPSFCNYEYNKYIIIS